MENEVLEAEEPKKRKRIKVGTVITWIVAVLLIALIVYFVVCTFSHKVPMLFNHALLRIVSSSMDDLDDNTDDDIHAGDFILIRKIAPADVRVGNVITFYSDDPDLNGAPNTHRVKEIVVNGDGSLEFVTQGDNPRTNMVPDKETAKGDKVVGLYIGKVKPLQFIGNLMKSGKGFILLLIPALILFAIAAREIAKSLKKEAAKEENNSMPEEDSEEMRRLVQAEIERMKAAGELPDTPGQEKAPEKNTDPTQKDGDREPDDHPASESENSDKDTTGFDET